MKVQKTTVKGVINWARLTKDNLGSDFNDNPQYELQLTVPKSTAEKWHSSGLTKKINQTKDGDYFLKLKCPEISKGGKEMEPPKVVHEEGYIIDGNTVGNGSTGECLVSIIPYDNKFGKGYVTYLKRVTIDNLEEYIGNDVESADEFEF